ncbi:MAG: hypothetical protein ACPGVG_15215 [Mycobacterium sp.]
MPSSALLGSVQVAIEPTGNWQEDLTASATFVPVAVVEAELHPQFEQETLEPKPLQQFKDGYVDTEPGWETAMLDLTVRCSGLGSSAGDGVTSSAEEAGSGLQVIMGQIFGGFAGANTGDTVNGTPVNNYSIPYAGLGSWAGGEFMGWEDSSSIVHCHEVASVSGNTATLITAFGATPGDGNELFQGNVFYLAEDPTDALQFLVHGAENHNKWLLTGCQLNSPPTLSRVNGELADWTFQFKCTKVALEASGSLAAVTYVDRSPLYVDGELRIGVVGATTRTLYHASEVAYTFNSPSWWFQPTHNEGMNGFAGTRRQRPEGPAVEVSFTIPWDDNTWRTHRANKQHIRLTDQWGTTGGNVHAISIPNAQVTGWQSVGHQGKGYQRITARSQLDTYVTNGGNAELARSPVRICAM